MIMKTAIKDVLRHEWLNFTRSSSFESDLVGNIFIMLPKALMLLYFLFIGIFLNEGIKQFSPEKHPVVVWVFLINMVYFAFFIIKFLFKSSKSTFITPYLLMPIKLDSLLRISFYKELISFWNLVESLLSIPFLIVACHNVWKVVAVSALVFILSSITTLLARRLKNLMSVSALFLVVALFFVALWGGMLYCLTQVSCLESILLELIQLPAIVWYILDILLFYSMYKIYLLNSKSEVYLIFDDPNYSVILNKLRKKIKK